jgi:hypothetical protein
MSSSTPG